MKQQKTYKFLQKQILLMIGLSLLPGLVYVVFGWVFDVLTPALIWYIFLVLVSFYGLYLYREFEYKPMDDRGLHVWYKQLTLFMYIIFISWSVIFVVNIQYHEYNLHYIAIFTQLGASVVASALLVSDRKLFIPILLILMLPLSIYFLLLHTWFGYVLSFFSLIFGSVLLYAAYNTNKLIEENYYNAQHDILTGLHNRRYYLEYMDAMLKSFWKNNTVAYMLLIDLDHFKTINDSLGHDIGDEVLQEVARRIKSYCKESRLIARLGGDEFIVISKDLKIDDMQFDNMYIFADGLLSMLKQPYIIQQHHLYLSASIGVSQIDDSFDNPNYFLKEADLAMYEAKSEGRDGIMIFNKLLSDRVHRNLAIEQKLHLALKTDKINVYYQPLFDVEEKMIGCEALARWTDKELGILSPNEFIPIAENTGLILELGIYILRKTFKTLHYWNEHNVYLEHFSINISLRQLMNESFVREVEVLYSYYFGQLKEKPTIIFEITEHVFSHETKKIIATMGRLKVSGISFSIDDFGTGYSSLNYLQELPIEEVKIDKCFIAGLGKKSTNENMIITILSIAENFSLRTIAEGVESKAQFDTLKSFGCTIFQGFYFDKALSKRHFERKYLSMKDRTTSHAQQ